MAAVTPVPTVDTPGRRSGILDCRFGGPHYYFGQLFDKPYIGENDRILTTDDMRIAIKINRRSEVLAIVLLVLIVSLHLS